MKKYKVLTIMGIFMVSAMIFSVPPAAAVAPVAAANEDYFLFGTTSLGYDLDPQFSWDSASSDINSQIWEGLFAYHLGDPSLRVIPRLAADCGVWRPDGLMYDVKLREGVTFHNGDKFNATAVVFSFQRLYELCVYENDQVTELYFPYGLDETLPNNGYIINSTTALDEYTVRFELNFPYMPFQALLCFSASYIMHPDTPMRTYLQYDNINNGTAIGTGPYMATEHTTEQVVFEYYPDYHRGTPAILRFKYLKYVSSDTIATALLAQDIDLGAWSADFLQDMIDAEHMIVGAKRPNTIISYLGYNNRVISRTMRHVMNMAINYTYIIDEIINGQATRMTSIVPPGIMYHVDCDVPVLDLESARALLIDDDFTADYELDETSVDADWIAVAESNSPVATYSYTYNLGNIAREDIGIALIGDFAKVGIRVNMAGVTWGQFLSKLYTNPDSLDLFRVGWMPDYNDPSNYINPLMSNTSAGNGAQVNDPTAQALIDSGISETNLTKREEIYVELQHYLAEDLQPWGFLFTGYGQNAINWNVTIQRNAMGYQYVFPWGWNGINTTFTAEEEVFQEMWCSEASSDVPDDYWPEEEEEGGGIPGYSMFVLLGVVAATIVAIIKKRK